MSALIENVRWLWRQLTSMRTALFLLFLLALASVPGSLIPQRGSAPLKVNQYLRDHPRSGPIMDKFHLFDVFASPWFGAIYLLLFISLTGCVFPRAVEHYKLSRALPPVAPKNLMRLPGHMYWKSSVPSSEIVSQTADAWKKAGWRVVAGDDYVSAEKGFARETGNVVFHIALLAVLFAVGFGSSQGFRGTVIVREGSGFANNVTQYDSYTPGRLFSSDNLEPFSFALKKFTADYQRGGMQNGAARNFTALVDVKSTPSAPAEEKLIEVNHPLRVGSTSVYLVGHGYAPEFTLKDKSGKVVWQDAAVFLPQDGNFTSTGVVKAPDTVPQLGIQGFFLPTVTTDFSRGPKSTFPAADDPAVYLSAWKGDLGLDSGVPQSVYRLDTKNLTRIGIEELKPGESWTLPGGSGSLAFTGYREWASFSISHDPGKLPALIGGIFALFGLSLSLLIARRRAWLRVTPADDGTNLVEVAGLSKTEHPGLEAEVAALARLVPAKGE